MKTILKIKRTTINILSIVLIVGLQTSIWSNAHASIPNFEETLDIDKGTKHCISCHGEKGYGKAIVEQWKQSRHAASGVGCLECHAAEKDDLDAFDHEGYTIATIVTPKDCAQCHEEETNQFLTSHHADAGMIMGSLDNVLAEVVEGHAAFQNGANPAAANGCWQCHGSKIEVRKDADGNTMYNEEGILLFDPKTWPNTGIGRINLDGSKGACSACHNRHAFDVAQVRQPENCGKCHIGTDHPQLEIYNESKHGINFYAHRDKMNLSAQPWIVGEDYSAAPTCATCHMSATPDQPVTHDVGDRISWTLRPKVSEKIDAAALAKFKANGKPVPEDFLTWEQRRKNMINVCSQCHTKTYINNFYYQYDSQVNLYNEKYGKPGLALMKSLKANKLITPLPFDDQIEWDYFYLWHHEGRRARMGAAMMGPDYTQWHGNFDLAENFYTKIVPGVKELIAEARKHGNTIAADNVQKELDTILNSEMHRWYLGKMSPEEAASRKEAARKFRERYSND